MLHLLRRECIPGGERKGVYMYVRGDICMYMEQFSETGPRGTFRYTFI